MREKRALPSHRHSGTARTLTDKQRGETQLRHTIRTQRERRNEKQRMRHQQPSFSRYMAFTHAHVRYGATFLSSTATEGSTKHKATKRSARTEPPEGTGKSRVLRDSSEPIARSEPANATQQRQRHQTTTKTKERSETRTLTHALTRPALVPHKNRVGAQEVRGTAKRCTSEPKRECAPRAAETGTSEQVKLETQPLNRHTIT